VKLLARRGAKVYLGARDESKATGAIAKMQAEGLGRGQVVWFKVDFSDPRLAQKAAEEFTNRESRLDILGTFFDLEMAHSLIFL
jgi:NAD(P)-dependent dehydrogenase (short-subunit alcohol dehydrogenase family)